MAVRFGAHSTLTTALRTFRVALVLGVLAAFWVPGARAAAGDFPAPLDDVYIYFDFARSTARGCVLCWTTDSGYSSGATSPVYALVLAFGYALGFHGMAIGWFAALVAAASLYDATGSIFQIAKQRAVGVLGSLLLLSVPLLDWSFASGMEVALLACLLGRATQAVQRATEAPPSRRAGAQLRAGLWLALVAVARPECAPLCFCFVIAIGHASGSTPLARSLTRAFAPTLLAMAALSLVNVLLTGEAAPAGAIRKLISSDPFASGNDVALMVVVHTIRLGTEGFDVALGGPWHTVALLVLAFSSFLTRNSRRIGVPLLIGALGALLLATLNKTAPFQNLRYVAPSLLLLLFAAGVGASTLAKLRRGAGLAIGGGLAFFVMVGSTRAFPRQIDHFSRAAKNIREQQVEVGRALGALSPVPRRVFVGDAGAIPYLSDRPALDGLGLGGYHDYPFARASVHGTAAVIELIERMPSDERPDILAIYDSWWPDLGKRFGRELFAVTIPDNVICGDPKKSVYRADWSLLEDRALLEANVVGRLDVGDLVAEREHDVTFSHPHAGYVFGATRLDQRGTLRFDAVRSFGEGQFFSFVARSSHKNSADFGFELVADSPADTTFELERESAPTQVLVLERSSDASWGHTSAALPGLRKGERLRIVAGPGGLRIGAISLVEPR